MVYGTVCQERTVYTLALKLRGRESVKMTDFWKTATVR
jgi:hypothetical protein